MIVLYSTNCPRCQTLKLLLKKFNILFEENNSVDDMIALGINKVPVLSVSGRLMEYKEAKEWITSNTGESR